MKKIVATLLTLTLLFLSMHAALTAQGHDNVSFGHLSVEDSIATLGIY